MVNSIIVIYFLMVKKLALLELVTFTQDRLKNEEARVLSDTKSAH